MEKGREIMTDYMRRRTPQEIANEERQRAESRARLRHALGANTPAPDVQAEPLAQAWYEPYLYRPTVTMTDAATTTTTGDITFAPYDALLNSYFDAYDVIGGEQRLTPYGTLPMPKLNADDYNK